jgi:hypothetical protein
MKIGNCMNKIYLIDVGSYLCQVKLKFERK